MAEELIDLKRKCMHYGGCSNLGEVTRKEKGKVYRRRLCTKHKRMFYENNYRDLVKA